MNNHPSTRAPWLTAFEDWCRWNAIPYPGDALFAEDDSLPLFLERLHSLGFKAKMVEKPLSSLGPSMVLLRDTTMTFWMGEDSSETSLSDLKREYAGRALVIDLPIQVDPHTTSVSWRALRKEILPFSTLWQSLNALRRVLWILYALLLWKGVDCVLPEHQVLGLWTYLLGALWVWGLDMGLGYWVASGTTQSMESALKNMRKSYQHQLIQCQTATSVDTLNQAWDAWRLAVRMWIASRAWSWPSKIVADLLGLIILGMFNLGLAFVVAIGWAMLGLGHGMMARRMHRNEGDHHQTAPTDLWTRLQEGSLSFSDARPFRRSSMGLLANSRSLSGALQRGLWILLWALGLREIWAAQITLGQWLCCMTLGQMIWAKESLTWEGLQWLRLRAAGLRWMSLANPSSAGVVPAERQGGWRCQRSDHALTLDGDTCVGLVGTEGLSLWRQMATLESGEWFLVWNDVPIHDLSPSVFRERIHVLSAAQQMRGRVVDVLHRMNPATDQPSLQRIWKTLQSELAISAQLDTPVNELSVRDRQALCLARAWLSTASVVMLEEPGWGLDADAVQRVLENIHNSQPKRQLLVSVSDERCLPSSWMRIGDAQLTQGVSS